MDLALCLYLFSLEKKHCFGVVFCLLLDEKHWTPGPIPSEKPKKCFPVLHTFPSVMFQGDWPT